MLSKFLQFFIPMLKDWNKKNKNKEQVFTDERLNHVVDLMNKLIKYDLETIVDKGELHLRLLSATDFIYHVSVKRKYKDKFISNFFDDLEYFEYVAGQLDLDNMVLPRFSLYEHPEYPNVCIEKYISLLLSKSLDYIPDSEKTNRNLEQVSDLFIAFKDRLFHFKENGLPYWVYLYTENVEDIPISLRYLNVYGNLGDKIEKWVEEFAVSKAQTHFNALGLKVFAGWGMPVDKVTLSNGELSKKEDKPKEENKYAVLSNQLLSQMAAKVYEHMVMFIYDDNFRINDSGHYELLVRTFAATAWNMIVTKPLAYGTVATVMRAVKTYANKTHKMRTRRDRNLWFTEEMTGAVFTQIETYCNNIIDGFATVTAAHIYDTCQDNGSTVDQSEVYIAHHGYLARLHNRIFYSKNKFSKEDISRFLSVYQDVLMPKYFQLISEDMQWIWRAALEFTMNIKDEERVNKAYDQLTSWFMQRHSTELNEEFYTGNLPYFLYMSYANKLLLRDKLVNEPIDIVKYGGSADTYEKILEILNKDIETPIMTHRIEDVIIGDNGVEVQPTNVN